MIQRIQSAFANGERLTGADANFYLHEAYEGTLASRGVSWETPILQL